MNIYEKFIKKQDEIIDLISEQKIKENELDEIKREIYKKHKERFKSKPFGKTTIDDGGFEVVYNRTEKISLLTENIKREGVDLPCVKEHIIPEKRELKFEKSKYNKLSDDERKRVDKYLMKEPSKPTMKVVRLDD